MSMSFPDQVRENLDRAIAHAIAHSVYLDTSKPTRKRIASREDIIRALLFMEGGSLDKELYKAGLSMTPSAFSQRRNEIPPELFDEILEKFGEIYPNNKTYKGYSILAVDGTAINIAKDRNAQSFVIHDGAPDGYNQLHATPVYDVMARRYYSDCAVEPEPRKDEIRALLFFLGWHKHDFQNKKTLIVADRLFGTYNVFATFQHTGFDFLIRVKQGRNAMKPIAQLPMKELDVTVSFTITTTQTREDKANGYILVQRSKDKNSHRWDWGSPYPMTLRIVRVKLDNGKYETLATSLPSSFTPFELKELYHARWGIEQAFRSLKYDLPLSHLHGRSEYFAYQEVYASLLMANICSTIINEVVVEHRDKSAFEFAVNRKMATYLIKEFFRTPGADGDKLMRDIARYTIPIRPGRKDVRHLKAKGFVSFVFRVAA